MEKDLNFFQKIHNIEVIKYEPSEADSNETVFYRFPEEDFGKAARLIVAPNQVAILVNEGECVTYGPGTHVLNDSHNSSFSLVNKFTRVWSGGESYYHCYVYFVNTANWKDLPFGTREPIDLTDPGLGLLVKVRANGYYSCHIDVGDEEGSAPGVGFLRFFKKIVGTRDSFTTRELFDYLRGKIIERLTTLLGETIIERKISVLQIASHMTELSNAMLEQMKPFFADLGVILSSFSFNSINIPEEILGELREAQMEATKMDIASAAMARKRQREGYTYQQEKGFDVLGTAAGNEATPGVMMGAGMGLGMGFGMGGAMGGAMGNLANSTMGTMGNPTGAPQVAPQPAAQGAKPCPSCGQPVPAGMKFCPNCGNKMGGEVCPNCGAELTPGAKFCPNCGNKIAKGCPNCGAELAPGAKFCPNCGNKI